MKITIQSDSHEVVINNERYDNPNFVDIELNGYHKDPEKIIEGIHIDELEAVVQAFKSLKNNS